MGKFIIGEDSIPQDSSIHCFWFLEDPVLGLCAQLEGETMYLSVFLFAFFFLHLLAQLFIACEE